MVGGCIKILHPLTNIRGYIMRGYIMNKKIIITALLTLNFVVVSSINCASKRFLGAAWKGAVGVLSSARVSLRPSSKIVQGVVDRSSFGVENHYTQVATDLSEARVEKELAREEERKSKDEVFVELVERAEKLVPDEPGVSEAFALAKKHPLLVRAGLVAMKHPSMIVVGGGVISVPLVAIAKMSPILMPFASFAIGGLGGATAISMYGIKKLGSGLTILNNTLYRLDEKTDEAIRFSKESADFSKMASLYAEKAARLAKETARLGEEVKAAVLSDVIVNEATFCENKYQTAVQRAMVLNADIPDKKAFGEILSSPIAKILFEWDGIGQPDLSGVISGDATLIKNDDDDEV